MKLPQQLQSYFRFSSKERLGIISVTAIILAVAVLPFFPFKTTDLPVTKEDSIWLHSIEKLQPNAPTNVQQQAWVSNNLPDDAATDDKPTNVAKPFPFNPNTITAHELALLGLREKTIQTILNFRNKGGYFYKADDFSKIYNLRPDEFARLRPFIVIDRYGSSPPKNNSAPITTAAPIPPRPTPSPIDVNTADTAAFQTLRGIGSKLAARIVNFREKLGGFHSVDQVGETFGVSPETFNSIKPYLQLHTPIVKKLDINTASYPELNAHPYISAKLAYLITKARKEKKITSPEELSPIVEQTRDNLEKILPYIRFGD